MAAVPLRHGLRLACWNVEWFAALFDRHGQLQRDDAWSARRDITRAEQADAIATVIQAVDADAWLITEAPDEGGRRGPSTVAQLLEFAAFYGLRQSAALIGFPSDTRQEIALWFDPSRLHAEHAPLGSRLDPDELRRLGLELRDLDDPRPDDPSPRRQRLSQLRPTRGRAPAPRFDGICPFADRGEFVRFSKPPLEVALTLPHDRRMLRLLGVHLKSKAPHGAENEDEARRMGLVNRHKQYRQAQWLRLRVEDHLCAGDDLIVLGDFNDGPGMDVLEGVLGRSSLEVITGAHLPAHRQLFSPWLGPGKESRPRATARFWNNHDHRYEDALIDFVLVSHRLRNGTDWRIWHPFYNPLIVNTPDLAGALLRASDHFPVTVDLFGAGIHTQKGVGRTEAQEGGHQRGDTDIPPSTDETGQSPKDQRHANDDPQQAIG